MPEAAEGRQPELGHRVLAAAGASVVSALLVNPLDVIKTRVQASYLVADRPLPSCLFTRHPARWVRSPSLADGRPLPAGPATGCATAIGSCSSNSSDAASKLYRPLLGRLPMSSCACALKVADLSPGSLGTPERCLNSSPYRPPTATGVLRDILRKEGVPALWRGTDTAILASIPMVGVYMPLYDHLLQRTAPSLGPAYAPIVAGSAARTLAVLLVGPLELVRTRQQGGAAGSRTAWEALRETLRESVSASVAAAPAAGTTTAAAAAAATGSSAAAAGGGGTSSAAPTAAAGGAPGAAAGVARGGVLRGLPRLWTGVGATLARDVPFSAIYWGLVEPLRGGLLARWGQAAAANEVAAMAPVTHGSASLSAAPLSLMQQQPQPQQSHVTAAAAPSGRAVLAANLIAGSTAGAVAAVITTPFDVVKTRLQMGLGDARSSGRTSMEVARRVVAEEGPAGLFRGWGPRAVRTAPACAVVVASYEVLKLLL